MNYDLIIIGAGPAGYVAAEYAGKHKLKTLVVEKEYFGGVCLNVGCIPTKTLLKRAKIVDYLRHAQDYGISINGQVALNWNQLLEQKGKVVSKLVGGVKAIIASAKAETVMGEAKVLDPNTVEVAGKTYTTKSIVVATGSRPRYLTLPGFAEARQNGFVIDSTQALSLEGVPRKLVVVGGGVIGIEFAFLYASLGSEVTILQGVDRILEIFDTEVSDLVAKLLQTKNVKIITNAQVTRANNNEVFYSQNGQEGSVVGDRILVSIGRIPNTECLNGLNLQRDERNRIVLNQDLQTSIPNIYIVGDANAQLMLAHFAYQQGRYAVNHILNKKQVKPAQKLTCPSCIYTNPEVASVGYTEMELKKQGIPYVKTNLVLAHCGKAIADNETNGFVKMMFDPQTGKILGCCIIAATASDMIAELALAMDAGLTVFDIANSISPHPTINEMIADVCKKALFDHFK
ncbi:dihydrolipoyl dehydrogenase [Mycoplasmoides pneumoniae]|uniref:dihydrolipoyl dehydrogenase n=1 Tax=Mycoplasmoides pneumoniae TaxID=2104 RepID=UPI0013300BF7|nr:dihydrolipoyl dehydrogenase [Mycoplasmoides pneumoniae]